MDQLKQEAIKSYFAELVESMDPLRVMDHLAKLLSLEDMEIIREPHSTYQERNRKLISILCRKRETLEPFERFVKALEKTDANHEAMAKDILSTYRKSQEFHFLMLTTLNTVCISLNNH
uniref:CARD domain-containing protein n=1 Tax=Plectus sambesii TaxID=2011161 RepID=A0A914VEQ1_9BILA